MYEGEEAEWALVAQDEEIATLKAERGKLREALEWYGGLATKYHESMKTDDLVDGMDVLVAMDEDAGKRAREAPGDG